MDPTSRVCTKCGLNKLLSEFSRAPRGKYGVKASCKGCDAARYAANPLPSRAMDPEEKTRRLQERRGDLKCCTKCGEYKTFDRFSLSRTATATTSAVYRPLCKECQASAARQWYAANEERARANSRRFNLAKNYGISPQDYADLLRKQGNVCAICGKPETVLRKGRLMQMPVDHDHDTGAVRGLLCQRCNRAIGLLGDDPILLRKAISYLLRHAREGNHQGGQ